MEDKDLLLDIADAITDTKRRFRVLIIHPSFRQKLLIKLKVAKPYKDFYLKPLVLGKMVEISKLLLKIDVGVFTKKTFYDRANKLVVDSAFDMAHILAIAVCSERTPSESLIQFFYDNLSLIQLNGAAKVIIEQTDLTNFLSGIISIKGLNILEMNPETDEENPASTEPLEAS